MKISVVIPYYQRSSGLLLDALLSIFGQQGAGLFEIDDIRVVVVDDRSPVDPWLDIDQLPDQLRSRVVLIELTRNLGPAAARNAGLDAVSSDTDYVGFLDSDEVWTPVHLKNAITALKGPAALYFANYTRAEWEADKFAIAKFSPTGSAIVGNENLISLNQNILGHILLKAVARIQTVVIDWTKLSLQRFDTVLRIGEDSDYIARAYQHVSERAVVCMEVETVAAKRGVNISQNQDDDVHKELQIRSEMLRYQKHVLKKYGDENVRFEAKTSLHTSRLAVLYALHGVWTKGSQGVRGLRLVNLLRIDPGFPLWLLGFARKKYLS